MLLFLPPPSLLSQSPGPTPVYSLWSSSWAWPLSHCQKPGSWALLTIKTVETLEGQPNLPNAIIIFQIYFLKIWWVNRQNISVPNHVLTGTALQGQNMTDSASEEPVCRPWCDLPAAAELWWHGLCMPGSWVTHSVEIKKYMNFTSEPQRGSPTVVCECGNIETRKYW